MTDSEIWGDTLEIEGSDFSVLKEVEDLINVLGAVRSLPLHSFVCSAHEFLKIFLLLL